MWKTTLYETSKLTIELREIVENGTNIWAFDYPSYYKGDEKTAFEKKVIDHFYLRQIGQETVGRFLHMFRTKIREIMPFYIDMYKTVEIMDALENPFDNVDMTETFEQSTESESGSNTQGESTSNNSNEHRFSNTPQGTIDNLDNYLTEAAKDENTGAATTKATSEGTASGHLTHQLHRKGNQGVNTYAHDMIEYRTSIIDVDMMIINELNCLFLGVY